MTMLGIMGGGRGVQISVADGGFIIEWMERRQRKSSEPGYLEAERQSLGGPGCFPGPGFMPPVFKRAVRVDLSEALKYAGEILKQLEKTVGEDFEGGEFFQAGG